METSWDDESLTALRVALSTRTGAVVDLVRRRLTDEVLQLVGDALIAAVDDHIDGAHEVAAQCAAALRLRDWTGDADLADPLEAALGMSATPMLRPVAVDLEELSSLLEGDPAYGGGRIDLRTGQTWPTMNFDDAFDDETDDDPDRWLYVRCTGSRAGYRDMELFIESVADPAVADRLDIAITGRGAFRRFKDVLSRWPDEVHRYWLFADERRRGRARGWLADEGYRPRPPLGPVG
ncbi:UPF0158 family protein [Rhodococcus sp. NPDC059968]|uniref:UPF0158 family protein n=1 Tax=Rhodococcus sp. NPDC059968 TaxID=3347017 RepID=UPI00366D8B9A